MNRKQYALAMGIMLLPLVVNATAVETDDAGTGTEGRVLEGQNSANAPDTDENAKTSSEGLVLDDKGSANAPDTDENAAVDIEGSAPDGNTADPEQSAAAAAPEILWHAQAGTLTARIDWASIHQVVDALEDAGVRVKTHPSWEQVRISASFDDLPIQQAAERLFGKTFLLEWSVEPGQDAESSVEVATKGPVIRLLPVVDGEGAIAGETTPYDAEDLEALVDSNDWEQAIPALEAALLNGDEQQRAAALALMERRNVLGVDRNTLQAIAEEDANPERRQQALAAIGKRIHEPDAARDVLAHSLQNDPDANVRAAAKAALDELARDAEYLYKRDLKADPDSQAAPGSQTPSTRDKDISDYSLRDDASGLHAIAHGDADAARRQQALQAIGDRVHEPDASWAALTHALQNDPDANVRATAQSVMTNLNRRVKYLYKRDLESGR